MQTVEFRDGERDVPDHVAELLRGHSVYAMTYEQAIRYAERVLERNELNRQMNRVIDEHFKRTGWD